MDKRSAAISEAAGSAVIYIAAVFLHFAYSLFPGSALGMLYGAVNESVWEHVKIFSAAYTGYALLQLCWIKAPFRRYVAAKCAGLYFLMTGMTLFYYAYTFFTGTNILWADIISSLLLVAGAQLISYRIMTSKRAEEFFLPAIMLIMLYYLMFFSFTVFPPRADLFRDPVSGNYGIAK